MFRYGIIALLLSVAAFAQSTTKITVFPKQDDSSTGTLDHRELYQNGTNYVGWKAPANIPSSFRITLPSALPAASVPSCLKINSSGISSTGICVNGISPAEYNWSQVITATGTPGTKTITLTPGVLGVSASDTVSKYYLTGSPGVAEVVSSTGTGTCNGTVTTSCTIQVITANSHTGTTTIYSATAGTQEAINASTTAAYILYPAAGQTWYAPAYTNGKNVVFQGQGVDSAITLATPSQVGIWKNTANYMEIRNLSVIGDTTTTGVYVKGPVENSGTDKIIDCFFQNHNVAINHRTVSETYITSNRFYTNEVGIETVNEINNDAGGLYVVNNQFLSNTSSTSKDIWYHGPSAAWFERNSFLGSRDTFVADLTMATVDVSGTAVTATSGRFYPGFVGSQYYIDGNLVSITVYIDETHVTIGTNLGTLSGVQFGQILGQFHFSGNNFDNQNRTGMSFPGKVSFGGIQIKDNSFSNFFGTEKYTGISITNPNIDQVDINDNRFTNLSGLTYDHTGIYMTYTGKNLSITDNKFSLHKYSINLDLVGTTNSTDTHISGNTFLGDAGAGTIGIRLSNALRVGVTANEIANYLTGVSVVGASSAEVAVLGTKVTCPATGVAVLFAAGVNHSVAALDAGTACALAVQVNSGVTVKSASIVGTYTNKILGAGSFEDNVNTAVIKDSGTSTSVEIGSATHSTSGTPVAGFGVTRSTILQDDGGTLINVGGIRTLWEDPAAANRYSKTEILVGKNNTLYIGATFDHDRNATFYNNVSAVGTQSALKYATTSDCTSVASPAVCGSAGSGSAVVAAGATTVVVNTTAVTGNSQIQLTVDNSLSTKLGVTCNTTFADSYISARTIGVSFTITTSSAPVTDPRCYSWTVIN